MSVNKAWASSNSFLASIFSRMAGYRPRSSQVWKKGDQSMKGTRSESVRSVERGASGVLRVAYCVFGLEDSTRGPVKDGLAMSDSFQSNLGRRLRAFSSDRRGIVFLWACCW